MNIDFIKEKMEKGLEAVEFYEKNRDKILASIPKTIKYSLEIQKVFEKEFAKAVKEKESESE